MMSASAGRVALAVAALTAATTGCRGGGPVSVESRQSALTWSDVMGFETSGAWTTTSGTALALDPAHTEGTSSLAVTPGGVGWNAINGAAVSATGKAKLALDIMLPLEQPNAGWYGNADVYASCPSKAVYNAFIGSQGLSGLPVGVWQTLVYDVPEPPRAALAGGCTDLMFQIVLNVPTPAGKYRLDNLRFADSVTRTGCGATADGTVCTVGDVLGFENAAWWQPNGDGPTIVRVADHTQGSYALEVAPSASSGYSELRSVPLNGLGLVGPTLAMDVKLPVQQPNPSWYGYVEVTLTSAQAGLAASLGQVQLTGLPLGLWQTVSLNVGVEILTKLLGSYDDLVVKVILNVPAASSGGKYYVDNIRLAPAGGCGGMPNGVACDDGNRCTRTDSCQNGACVGANPVTCASTVCHQPGSCDPGTGQCVEGAAVADGTVCDDENLCTTGETCQGGTCAGGAAVDCGASTTCRTQAACVPSSGCPAAVLEPDGTSCDDGDFCTQTDACSAGACVGTNPVVCQGTACRAAGTCDPASGTCSVGAAINENQGCNDNEPCTAGEACHSGSCNGGSTVDCGASTECSTQAACVPTQGCPAPVPQPDGTSCDDTDRCTSDDVCQAGACAGTPKTCEAKNSCYAGVCDPATGQCTNSRKPAEPGRSSRFDYDGAGRQIQDGDAELVFNGYDQLVEVRVRSDAADPANPRLNSGKPVMVQKHTYGFDGQRTSTTTTDPRDSTQKDTRVWFSANYSKHNGRREHYVTVGDRIIAKVVTQASGSTGVTAAVGALWRPASAKRHIPPEYPVALLLVGLGLGFLVFASTGNSRRRRWIGITTGVVGFTFTTASCDMFGYDSQSAAAWDVAETTFFHQGVAAGPELITNKDGGVFEERRFEPFGEPLDAWNGTPVGPPAPRQPVDLAREPLNALNKLSDPSTGWSYHGARWMAPTTARWLSPDPATKGPDAKHLAEPWDLNPYQYARQNPALYWDPDGRDVIIYVGLSFGGLADSRIMKEAETLKQGLIQEYGFKSDAVHIVRLFPRADGADPRQLTDHRAEDERAALLSMYSNNRRVSGVAYLGHSGEGVLYTGPHMPSRPDGDILWRPDGVKRAAPSSLPAVKALRPGGAFVNFGCELVKTNGEYAYLNDRARQEMWELGKRGLVIAASSTQVDTLHEMIAPVRGNKLGDFVEFDSFVPDVQEDHNSYRGGQRTAGQILRDAEIETNANRAGLDWNQ